MPPDQTQITRYLAALFESVNADANTQVNMYEIGSAIGMEKNQAGKIAEELIFQGLVEIKTLSGGIGLTREGVEAAKAAGGGRAPAETALADTPILSQKDHRTVQTLLDAVRARVPALEWPYENLEALIMDLKTADVHLLSPMPKTAVIRAVLRAMQAALAAAGDNGLADRLKRIAGP